jgi:hypothetical protein
MSKEQFTIGELWLTKGIRAGKRKLLAKMLKFYVAVPAAKVANRFVTSTNMKNGAYTIVNSGLPGDGLAHNVSITLTRVDTVDTLGVITVTGLDIAGKIITEVITPVDNTKAVGAKAFKQVTSLIGSGWAQGGTGADTLVIGFDDLQGLPDFIADASDILMVALDTALVNAPTVAVSATVLASNTVSAVGDGTKKHRVLYQV